MSNSRRTIPTIITIVIASVNIFAQQGNDWVDGQVHTFINGGSWCWFQDERAVVDTVNNKLIVGSTDMQAVAEVAIINLESKNKEGSKRFSGLGNGKQDDHNAPGLVIAGNGNYICMWAHHYDSKHHYSIYSNGNWSNERTIEWGNWASGRSYDVAYSNLCYLSDEKRIYNFSRVFDVRSQHFVYSDDNGGTWKFGGKLTTHNVVDTYNRGYYKYWGNGVDRIDMCFTEEHPRDQKTSIYHGYIKDNKAYDSFGEVADEDIYNGDYVPTFEDFTRVFAHGTEVNGDKMGRCWQSDICRYDDGSVAILFFARANDDTLDHRNFYTRYDGTEWKTTYLGKAGRGIYDSEQDYTGLGALNPDDPNRIYICSRYNPADDEETPAGKREIWRGTTEDLGANWEWEPVTANSSQDNFRPIIPKWKPGKEALLWFRANYIKAQDIRNSKVIGTFYEYEPPVVTKPEMNVTERTKAVIPLMLSVSGHQVHVQYHVQKVSPVTLKAFSLSGKRISTLVNGVNNAGSHNFNWNTARIPAGTYLVRLSVGSSSYLERMIIQR